MPTSLDVVKDRLRTFADSAVGESPLYTHLASCAAEDADVAELLTPTDPDDPRAVLLFLAAAHRLVLADPVCELSQYYPSVGGECGVDAKTWPLFRSFVLDRTERIRELITSHIAQPNEVRRAAALYPAVALAAKQARGPIGLLEVGTSAGLLLGMDRYAYRYQLPTGEQMAVGPAKAALVLHTLLEPAKSGGKPPAMPRKLNVAARVGLDQRPVDLRDEDQLAWLEACVWADQPERLRLLNMAAAAQAKQPPELLTGDAVDDLLTAAEHIPAELPLVVFDSHAIACLPPRRRPDFVATVAELAKHRPLWWISLEDYESALVQVLPERPDLRWRGGSRCAVLALTRWIDGTPEATVLAQTSTYGDRIKWLN
ncbi:MAG TPA: DUF2332 domain-containing protein [Pseudonocardiaceae bacterium]